MGSVSGQRWFSRAGLPLFTHSPSSVKQGTVIRGLVLMFLDKPL